MKTKGYIIKMQIENYPSKTYLYADEDMKIRSICDQEGLIYMTKEERWSPNFEGSLEGIVAEGMRIGVFKDEKPFEWNKHYLTGKVLSIEEVSIEKEAEEDPGIAGLTRPVFEDRSQN